MATSSQILAANMAQGGGVVAQLAMGRDKISLAQMQQQRNMEAQRLAQAMQLAQMDQEMERARMDQQQQQFMSGQDFDRQRMAEDQRRFGMTFGLDEQQANRQQALFDMEQQQRMDEQMAQEAMGAIQAEMAQAENVQGFLAKPVAQALGKARAEGKIDDRMYNQLMDEAYEKDLELQRISSSGGGGTTQYAHQAYRNMFRQAYGRDPNPNEDATLLGASRSGLGQGLSLLFPNLPQSQPSQPTQPGGDVRATGSVVRTDAQPLGARSITGDALATAAGKKESQVGLAKTKNDLIKARPKAKFALKQLESGNKVVSNEIEKARNLLKNQTALGRVTLANVPVTEAKALKAAFTTIKANMGFDQIGAMREASQNGAALGNVTEREIEFLQGTQGVLDNNLDLETLLNTMNQIEEFRAESYQNRIDLYNDQFGILPDFEAYGGAGFDYGSMYGLE